MIGSYYYDRFPQIHELPSDFKLTSDDEEVEAGQELSETPSKKGICSFVRFLV